MILSGNLTWGCSLISLLFISVVELDYILYLLRRAAFWVGDGSSRAMVAAKAAGFRFVSLGIRHLWLRPRRLSSMQADQLQPLLRRLLQPFYLQCPPIQNAARLSSNYIFIIYCTAKQTQ